MYNLIISKFSQKSTNFYTVFKNFYAFVEFFFIYVTIYYKEVKNMEFLTNLERFMASYNMNRSEVARACGLSTSTVNSWWNRGCDNISLQTLLKLSKAFNCTLEELVHGEPELSFVYTSNEFTTRELRLIKLYATFLKTTRKDGGINGN